METILIGAFILLMIWSCSDECANKSMTKCVGTKVREINKELKEGLEGTNTQATEPGE